jgi:hypothetical protein
MGAIDRQSQAREARMQRLLTMTVGGALLSSACFVANGHAQDPSKTNPPPGAVATHPFEATFTTVIPDPPKPVALGTRKVVVASSFITVLNFTSEPLGGRCHSIVDQDETANTFLGDGYCDVENSQGDHVYLDFKIGSPNTPGIPSKNGQVLGGTGKFANATGSFVISGTPILQAEDVAITSGTMVGSYSTSTP